MAQQSFRNRLFRDMVYSKIHVAVLFSCPLLFLLFSPPAVSITIDISVEGGTKNGVTLIKIEDIPERKEGGVVVASSITVKKNLTSA